MRPIRLVLSFLLLIVSSSGLFAEDRSAILSDITKFANDNCAAFASAGGTTSTSFQAGVDAGLSGLIRKFSGLGLNADAEIAKKVRQYQGPIQDQLSQYVNDRESCRIHIIDELLKLFFPATLEKQAPKPPIEATLCTGEYEGNCPGPHNLYVGCPNRTAEQLVSLFCPSKNGSVTPIKTGISGNQCGYSLLHLSCQR